MLNRKPKSKLVSFDAFTKTEEDVRIRTNTGGLITILSMIIGLMLLSREWYQFNELSIIPQVVVDRDRHLKLDLNFDITFPYISCDILTMDIMDQAGDLQLDLLESGFTKTRVAVDELGRIHDIESSVEEFQPGGVKKDQNEKRRDTSEYCGSCYGAIDQQNNNNNNENLDNNNNRERVCCQTCDEVHEAYLKAGWAFYDGAEIEQCEREGYVSKIRNHINEGCRVKGKAKLNRIDGEIHFAPGKSYENYNPNRRTTSTHLHDTSLYFKYGQLNFNHIINHFSFGSKVEDIDKTKFHGVKQGNGNNNKGDNYDNDGGANLSTMVLSPMDGRVVMPKNRESHYMLYSYFAKIVPTRYEYFNSRRKSVETAQFSVTYHDRSLRGGRDEDHPTTLHARGGIPGVYIRYEMSPVKVINREVYIKSWSNFLLGCITTIGSVLAVATVSDRVFYKAQQKLLGKKRK